MIPPILLFTVSYIIGIIIADLFSVGIITSALLLTAGFAVHILLLRNRGHGRRNMGHSLDSLDSHENLDNLKSVPSVLTQRHLSSCDIASEVKQSPEIAFQAPSESLVSLTPRNDTHKDYRVPVLVATSSILFLCFGIFLTSLLVLRLESGLVYKAAKRSLHVTVEGALTSDPVDRNGVSSFDLRVGRLVLDGRAVDKSFSNQSWVIDEKLKAKIWHGSNKNLYMGQHIRASGFLKLPGTDGDFNYRRYLRHKGIMAILEAENEDIEAIPGKRFKLISYAGSIRWLIKERYLCRLPKDQAALLTGIVLGDSSLFSDDLKESFKATGLMHIVAASGINIALIIGFLWPLLRLLHFRAGAQLTTLILCTALYTVVSGLSPSITRAFLMAAIGLTAWFSGRENNALSSLSTSALILAIIDPFILYDIGFQLSFVATASLILLVPILDQSMAELPRSFRSALSVTIAAQAGVLPISIYYFGQISTVFLIANLAIAPLAAPALILGMITIPVDALLEPIGNIIYLILRVTLGFMLSETRYLANIPGSYMHVGTFSIALAAASYVFIAFMVYLLHRIKLKISLMHILALLIGISLVSVWWHAGRVIMPSQAEITFLDVGQGDSAIITSSEGMSVLIDGGPDPDMVWHKLERRGIRKIDAIFISHAHADHIAGIGKLFNSFTVGSFIYPNGVEDSKAFQSLYKLAKKRGVRCIKVDDDDVLRLGRELVIDVLYAIEGSNSSSEDENEESAMVMVECGKLKALFTGDAGEVIEDRLVSEEEALDADILKVGHHGSAFASTRSFLNEVSPEVSVISVGKNNRYGHPTHSAIKRLLTSGSKIFRTDKHGDVTISSNGAVLQVCAEKSEN